MLRWDRRSRLDVLPYQRPGLLERAGLTAAQCQEAVWFVYPDGRQYRAAAAANQTLHALGGLWRLVSGLYRLPGFRQMEDAVYAWVARNRYRFPGSTAACATDPNRQHPEGSDPG